MCGPVARLPPGRRLAWPVITIPAVISGARVTGSAVGPVVQANIQRVAAAMLEFGVIGRPYAAEVRQGTLVQSMIG
jgi:hypothetical protein